MMQIRRLYLNFDFSAAAKKRDELNIKEIRSKMDKNNDEELKKILCCEMRLDLWEIKSYYAVGDYKKALDLVKSCVNKFLENTPEFKNQNFE